MKKYGFIVMFALSLPEVSKVYITGTKYENVFEQT